MDYLLEGEITVAKRIWAFVLLVRAWIVWVLIILLQFTILILINALFNSTSTGDELSVPPILAQSKALIRYTSGDSEPLAQFAAYTKDMKENRAKYQQAAQAATQASTRAEIADPGFRRRMAIALVITIIIIVGAFKFFGYI